MPPRKPIPVVPVYWTRPMTFEALAEYEDRQSDRLYAVVGRYRHGGTGRDALRTLFYIGTTRQFIYERLARPEHKIWQVEEDHGHAWQILTRVGAIVPEHLSRLSKQLVLEVEAAQIFHHEPPFNVRNVNSYFTRPMVVENWTRSGKGAVPELKHRFEA